MVLGLASWHMEWHDLHQHGVLRVGAQVLNSTQRVHQRQLIFGPGAANGFVAILTTGAGCARTGRA